MSKKKCRRAIINIPGRRNNSQTGDRKSFAFFVAYISLSLAIINLLPIPILDGGHIIISLTEVVIRRKILQRWVENAQKVGLAILIAIMVFAFYNDFDRFFGLSKFFNAK